MKKGSTMSAESRIRMALSQKGNTNRRGKKASPETRRRISEANQRNGNRPPSRLGVPNTPEQRQKIRDTLRRIGHRPPPMYGDANPSKRPEVRLKISHARKGKPLSEDHKRSLSLNHYKTHSLETRLNMSKSSHRGAEHHFWKGGVTKPNHAIRHSVQYRIWRDLVYRRDDFTCQVCGTRGGKLHAHHVESFANHHDKRFDLDNGQTLCIDCHREIHFFARQDYVQV